MKRAILLLLLAQSSCAPAVADPRRDAALILSEVVRAQVGIADRAIPPYCVQPRLIGAAFDDERQRVTQGRPPPSSSPLLYFHWNAPSTAPGIWATKANLDPGQAKLLTEAAEDIVRTPKQAPLVAAIERDGLPPSLRFCQDRQPARPNVYFSAPAVHGDLGFIEVGYVCGGLCGNGVLYALKRSGSGWQVVGVANTWVS